ncbi:MAG: nucleoside hydrolase [Bacteroidales bacterium]|nr:nucleoside hydrolase [Bacteroidales bacterium]
MKIFNLMGTLMVGCCLFLTACNQSTKIDLLFDTDANNELDDQHAIAYLLLHSETFNLVGLTTNATRAGGDALEQMKEAERVVTLMGKMGEFPMIAGATGSFEEIRPHVDEADFDGKQAVDFIISVAKKKSPDNKLTLLAVGKLTNVALALCKDPSISANIRLVWLGSNYPKRGEYNLENDVPSMNYVLDTNVEFEIATVNGGPSMGTEAVRISKADAQSTFAGKGPKAQKSITGRNGGEFSCFGDYSVDLFEHIGYSDEAKTRALFDMAAAAIVRNPSWAKSRVIAAPIMIDKEWVERPDNKRVVTIWEHFDKEAIINDFIQALDASTK